MELAALATLLTAVGGIIKLILSHLDKQRVSFELFLGNHMSGNTKALEDLVKGSHVVARRLEAMERRLPPSGEQIHVRVPSDLQESIAYTLKEEE